MLYDSEASFSVIINEEVITLYFSFLFALFYYGNIQPGDAGAHEYHRSVVFVEELLWKTQTIRFCITVIPAVDESRVGR